jgi:hypothetical protein
LIDYGNANILQKDESAVVLEFLDFYHHNNTKKDDKFRYIVFDSRFTNYENLRRLDRAEINFITIRRRGKKMLDRIANLPKSGWGKVKVECAGNKYRTLRVYDEQVFLKKYDKDIRQITITGNGKIKPAVMITNDFDLTMSILANNLYRLLALELVRYSHLSVQSSKYLR